MDGPNRPDGSYTQGSGTLYVFDTTNNRIVAYAKSDGHNIAQYQLAGASTAWTDLRGLLVVPSSATDVAPDLWWISSTGLHSALLVAAPDGANASPTPSPSPSASPSAKPGKSAKPGTTPVPTTSKGP
jgi:hypothetical protein